MASTSRSFGEFVRVMNGLADDVEKGSDELTRKIALAVDAAIVVQTPVDTGRARSNWLVSVGSPLTSEISSYGEAAAATSGALQQARKAVRAYHGAGSIFIANNLPYIQRLNEGSSAQAPAGFVEMGIVAAKAAVRGGRVLKR